MFVPDKTRVLEIVKDEYLKKTFRFESFKPKSLLRDSNLILKK
jgi:hypothetical protein